MTPSIRSIQPTTDSCRDGADSASARRSSRSIAPGRGHGRFPAQRDVPHEGEGVHLNRGADDQDIGIAGTDRRVAEPLKRLFQGGNDGRGFDVVNGSEPPGAPEQDGRAPGDDGEIKKAHRDPKSPIVGSVAGRARLAEEPEEARPFVEAAEEGRPAGKDEAGDGEKHAGEVPRPGKHHRPGAAVDPSEDNEVHGQGGKEERQEEQRTALFTGMPKAHDSSAYCTGPAPGRSTGRRPARKDSY